MLVILGSDSLPLPRNVCVLVLCRIGKEVVHLTVSFCQVSEDKGGKKITALTLKTLVSEHKAEIAGIEHLR